MNNKILTSLILILVTSILTLNGCSAENTEKKEELTRRQKINKMFSSIDGSVPELKYFIEDNYCKSDFKHLETTWQDGGKFILVTMKYKDGQQIKEIKAELDAETGDMMKIR